MNYLLPSGQTVQVDNEDDHLLKSHSWRLLWSMRNGKRHKIKAVRADIDGKCIRLHRLIMNAQTGQQVDHKDGDPLNNRRSNLRFCNHSQNAANKSICSRNKSGYKGVYKRPSGSYWARICCNYKTISLGIHDSAELAHEAYKAAAIKYHGEFAKA